MALTLLLTLLCIAGVFLMLFAEVAFIQDKRYLGTAPKDVQEMVQVHEERPGNAYTWDCGMRGSKAGQLRMNL